MANDLRILIGTEINESQSVGDINKSLRALSKKVNSLNIKINIDQSVLTSLASLSKNLGNITQQIAQQNATNVKNTQSINDQVKATESAIIAERKLGIEKERTNKKGVTTTTYGNDRNNNKQIVSTLPDGAVQMAYSKNQLKDYQDAEKMDRDHFNAIKSNKKMVEDMDKIHYLALQKNREVNLKSLESEYKQAEALEKIRYDNAKKTSDDTIKNSQQTQSLINSAFSGKQSVNSAPSGIADAKALDLLNRKYTETISRLNEAKNSGKQLTESELIGINRRIAALNSLSIRQKQLEKDKEHLSSTQQKAEILVNNLNSRYGSKVDSTGLNNLLSQVQSLNTSIPQFKSKAQSLVQQIQQIGNTAKSTSVETKTLGDRFKNTFSSMAMYAGIGSVFYGSFSAIKSGLHYIYELDTALTDLRKVTDETTLTYGRFLNSASDTANSIGGVTLDVVKSTTEWARLGYTIQQAHSLAKQTLVYQNVGDISSAEDASKSLISAVKGFGLEVDTEGKNITKIVDIYNEVGNKFAISSAGIGEALRRSAASMSEAGNTIEESVALATAANSTIQDPARVGQAMKTISMRLRGISEEGEDLTNLIPSLEEKFGTLGLSLKKDDQTFKSTYEIFQSLSGVWGKLSDFQRAGILEDVAGKLQGNIAASLINNFSDAEKSLESALNSTGSAARENEKHIESIAGRLNILKNSISSFWAGSVDSGFMKSIINMASSLVNKLDNLGNVLALATGLFLVFRYKAVATTIISLFETVKALTMTRVALQATASAAGGATVAMTGLQRAFGWIGLAMTGLALLYTVFSNLDNSIEKQNRSIENMNEKYEDLGSKLSEVSSYYKENFETLSTNTEAKNKLFNLQNELIDTYGSEADGIDLVNGKYEEQNDILEKLNKKRLEDQIRDTGIAVDSAKENKYMSPTLDKVGSNFLTYEKSMDEKNNTLGVEEYYKKLLELQEKIREHNVDIFASQRAIPSNAKEWENALASVQAKLDEIQPTYNLFGNYADMQKDQIKQVALEQVKLNDEQKKLFESISIASGSLSFEELKKSISGIVISISNFDGTNLDEVINKIKEIPQIKGNPEILSFLNQFLENSINAAEATKTASNAQGVLNTKVNDSIDSIQALYNAYEDLNSGEKLSLDTIQDLIKEYPDLIKHLKNKNGILTISKEGIELVAKAEETRFKNDLEQQKIGLKSAQDTMTAKLTLYGREVEALQALDKVGYLYSSGSIAEASAREIEFNEYKNIIDKIKGLDTLIGTDFNKIVQAEREAKANKKSNDTQSETNELLTEYQKRLNAIKTSMEDLSNKRVKLRQGSAEYRKSLLEEIKLLKEQKKIYDDSAKIPSLLTSTKVTTTSKGSDSTSSSSSSNSSSNSGVSSLISEGRGLQGTLNKYAQIGGEYKGTYDQFVSGATADCSQFVQEMFKEFLDIKLPRTAAEQAKKGTSIDKSDLQEGDLVFFNTVKKQGKMVKNSHVGIYSGNGKFLQMGSTKNGGLKESDMNSSYWSSRYEGARRVAGGSSSGNSSSSDAKTRTKNASASDLQKTTDESLRQSSESDASIYTATLAYIDDFVKEYENNIQVLENDINISKSKQEKLLPTSDAWRKEEAKQIDLNQKKIDEYNKKNIQVASLVSENKITSGAYEQEIAENKQKKLDLENENMAKRYASIQSAQEDYANQIEDVNKRITDSQTRASILPESTKEYRTELESQIKAKKELLQLNLDEINFTKSKLNNKNLNPTDTLKLENKLKDLRSEKTTIYIDIKTLNSDVIDSTLESFGDQLKVKEDELDLLQAKTDLLDADSPEYTKELLKQVPIAREKLAINQQEIAFLTEQLKREDLLATKRKEYNELLVERNLLNQQYMKDVKSIQDDIVNGIIEDYKKMIGQQKDLALEAIDKQKEAENKRHTDRIKNIDDEFKKFQDTINAQLKLLDRQNTSDDHETDLNKKLKERQELQDKINNLSLDTSIEGKARKKTLEEELATKDEEIGKFKLDRERELRKQNLTDQLEDRSKYNDNVKEQEDKANEDFNKKNEDEKKKTEQKFTDMLNDEKKFYELKQGLLSSDKTIVQSTLDELKSGYSAFFGDLKNGSFETTKEFENLNYTFTKMLENLEKWNGMDKDGGNVVTTPSGSGSGSGSNSGSGTSNGGIQENSKYKAEWDTYLSNKQSAELIRLQMEKTKDKTSTAYKALQTQFDNYKNQNEIYRKAPYYFPEGTYEALKNKNIFSAETGGYTGDFSGGKLGILHSKELVLNKGDTSKLFDMVKLASNFNIPNLSNLNKMIIGNANNQSQPIQHITNTYEVNIEKLNADEQGARTFFQKISDSKKMKGI